MAEPHRAFEIVEDDEPAPKARPADAAGTAMLLLGLKTLSQRALGAIADLFTLATVGSAFWLWMSIQNPTPYQLVQLAMYGVFVLAANWIVRRGK
jgi:hypothetical protein